MGFRDGFDGIPPSSITADMLADGAVTGTKLSADAIDGKTITGALFRTNPDGRRLEISDDGSAESKDIRFYTDEPSESIPGHVGSGTIDLGGGVKGLVVSMDAPFSTGSSTASFSAITYNVATHPNSQAYVTGEDIFLQGDTTTLTNTSRTMKGIDFGSFAGVPVDANGDVTINHGLGTTPVTVVVIPRLSTAARFQAVTVTTSSSFTVRTRDASGAPLAGGTNAAGYWIAIA